MKRFIVVTTISAFALLFAGAQAQEQDKKMDPAKHKQMMEMMKDSTMMNMMMGHMMSDRGTRMRMMSRMMEHAKKDSSSMMEMCRKMMGDSDMHSMMKKMMEGGTMMKHDMMPSDSSKGTKKPTPHDQHH
ncbi:MAG: hypothetical protein WEF53_05060 [Bacteroidota bacterium]